MTDENPRRFRLTRNGLYFYHRRYTLSLSWRGRWTNRPDFFRDTVDGGWTLVCGPLILAKDVWPEGDVWGEETHDLRVGILKNVVAEITGEGESVWQDLFEEKDEEEDES